MGLAHSPRIVTDGLVLALDAGNTKSYPGSGTTWTDLSGNSNTGTLTSMDGNNYNSANGGYLDFDGTDDYVDVSGSITVSAATFLAWVRLDGDQVSYTGVVFSRGSSPATGMNFRGGSENIGYHWNGAGSSAYNWDSGLTVPTQEWCMMVVTVTSSVATAYLCRSSGITSAKNALVDLHGEKSQDIQRWITQMIQLDPRPAYKNDEESGCYGMNVFDMDVQWEVTEKNHVVITSVNKIH